MAATVVLTTLTLGAGTAAAAAASTGVTSYTVTAHTKISGRPDSGDHGTWANDAMTRTASVRLVSEVALSYCGGSTPTGHCYHWTGQLSDRGTFTTIPGATSPGAGDLNGGRPPAIASAVTGPMFGAYRFDFYSSSKTARAAAMPASENDAGKAPGGRSTTDAWVEQFFGATARFYENGQRSDSLGTTGRWVYELGFGADRACPQVASRWVDSSWPLTQPWGQSPDQGNILVPNIAHC